MAKDPPTTIAHLVPTDEIPLPDGLAANLNLWMFRGRATAEVDSVEVVVSDFRFTPKSFSNVEPRPVQVSTTAPTTIVTIIIDDLGHYDTAVYNPNSPTPNLKKLADGGIRLGRHYTYKYCSPTRRLCSYCLGRCMEHLLQAYSSVRELWV